jgi:hypothetical protein
MSFTVCRCGFALGIVGGRVYSVVFAGNTVTIVPAYGCIHVRVPQVVGCINEADVDIARGTLRSTPPGQSSITSITVVA